MTNGGEKSGWGATRGEEHGADDGAWPVVRETGWGLARVLSDGSLEPIPLFDRAVVGCSGHRAGIVGVGGTDEMSAGARFTVRADGVYVESLDEACMVRVEGVPARTLSVADGDVVRMGELLAIFVERDLDLYQGAPELVSGELLFGPRQRPWLARARAHVASRESVVLTGGVSVGKWSLARHLAHEVADPAAIRQIEGDAPSHDVDWGAFPLEQTRVYLIRRIDKMSRSVQNELARLVRRTRDGLLIATVDGELADALTDGRLAPSIASLLAGHEISVPGLEERREDLAAMAMQLAGQLGVPAAAMTTDAREVIMRGGWPGGVDELRTVMWACLSEPGEEGLKKLRRSIARPSPRTPLALQEVDEDLARNRLRYALAHASGTVATAARELRMSRQSLYRELRRLGLTPPHQGVDSGPAS